MAACREPVRFCPVAVDSAGDLAPETTGRAAAPAVPASAAAVRAAAAAGEAAMAAAEGLVEVT